MRPKILAVFLALILFALSGGTPAGALSPAHAPVARAGVGALAVPRDTGSEQYLFDRLNEVRVEAGLSPLTRDPMLDQIALEWTDHQLPQGHISHRTDLADQVESRVTLQWRRIGENVGWGPSAEWLHDGFWNSAPHRANMLGDYNRVGIGARLEADGDVWVTVNFLKGPELPAVVAPAPSGPSPDVDAWSVTAAGEVTSLGGAPWFGDLSELTLAQPIVALESTPTGDGYWLVASDGGIFTFGDAQFHGSAAADRRDPVVGMAADPNTGGYWIITSEGQAIARGPVSTDPAPSPQCRIDPVIAGAFTTDGAWLVTRPLVVPQPPASAATSGIDGESIAQQIRYAQACQTLDPPETGSLLRPLSHSRVTSVYGTRLHPVWGVVQLHAGTDFARPGGSAGAPVVAADDGTVLAVDTRVAYGRMVIIDHGDKVATVYAHMSEVTVEPGQVVQRGDLLGLVGSTGFATGPHVHFEVRLDGDPVDPLPYVGSATAVQAPTRPLAVG